MGYGGDWVSKTLVWIDLGRRLKIFQKNYFSFQSIHQAQSKEQLSSHFGFLNISVGGLAYAKRLDNFMNEI